MTTETQSERTRNADASERIYGDLVWHGWCCWRIEDEDMDRVAELPSLSELEQAALLACDRDRAREELLDKVREREGLLASIRERDATLAMVRERAFVDGLHPHDEIVWDRSVVTREVGEWTMLVRLRLPDGTLPPNPSYFLGRRNEARTQLETAWGDVLVHARAGHEERPREPEPREQEAKRLAAMGRYLSAWYPQRLWMDVRRRLQGKAPLGSFGRRW